jgi:hypothetical protein
VSQNPRVHLAGGIYDSDGRLVYVDVDSTEERAWQIWLGWPDAAEIEAAKAKGFYFRKAYVAAR